MIFVRSPALPALACAASILLTAPMAWAQQTVNADRMETVTDSKTGGSQWGLGIGVGWERQPYRDFDNKVRGIPLLLYSNSYVTILGPGIDVHLPSAGPVTLRLRARYMRDGYEEDDSPFLAGMAERKGSVWLGGAAIWRTNVANVTAELLADGSGNSKGNKFRLQLDRRIAAGPFGITPRLAAQRLDEKYVDYYYGVEQSEVRIDRARYDGKAAVNVEVGVRIDYAIARKQNVFLDLSGTRLGTGIKDSSLVDRSSTSAVRVGYLYRF